MDGDGYREVIGFVSGTLTTVSFLPQVVKSLRTRAMRDISVWMWTIYSIGIAGWIAYGIVAGAISIILFNSISLGLAATILAVKLTDLRREASARQPRSD